MAPHGARILRLFFCTLSRLWSYRQKRFCSWVFYLFLFNPPSAFLFSPFNSVGFNLWNLREKRRKNLLVLAPPFYFEVVDQLKLYYSVQWSAVEHLCTLHVDGDWLIRRGQKQKRTLLTSICSSWGLFFQSNCRFCIIEGPETVQGFAKMELQEIQDNIRSRRNKIFLHMEEVRKNYSIQLNNCYYLLLWNLLLYLYWVNRSC